MDTFDVNLETRGDTAVLSLSGSAGVFTDSLLRRIREVLGSLRPRKIILNLAKLTFISSVALGVFILLHQELKMQGGKVAIVAPEGDIFQVITRCKLDAVMPIYSTVDAAMA